MSSSNGTFISNFLAGSIDIASSLVPNISSTAVVYSYSPNNTSSLYVDTSNYIIIPTNTPIYLQITVYVTVNSSSSDFTTGVIGLTSNYTSTTAIANSLCSFEISSGGTSNFNVPYTFSSWFYFTSSSVSFITLYCYVCMYGSIDYNYSATIATNGTSALTSVVLPYDSKIGTYLTNYISNDAHDISQYVMPNLGTEQISNTYDGAAISPFVCWFDITSNSFTVDASGLYCCTIFTDVLNASAGDSAAYIIGLASGTSSSPIVVCGYNTSNATSSTTTDAYGFYTVWIPLIANTEYSFYIMPYSNSIASCSYKVYINTVASADAPTTFATQNVISPYIANWLMPKSSPLLNVSVNSAVNSYYDDTNVAVFVETGYYLLTFSITFVPTTSDLQILSNNVFGMEFISSISDDSQQTFCVPLIPSSTGDSTYMFMSTYTYTWFQYIIGGTNGYMFFQNYNAQTSAFNYSLYVSNAPSITAVPI